MKEIHEDICGNYANGHSLAQKALKHEYYWPNIRKDEMDFADMHQFLDSLYKSW